ncbi:MAG: protein translocase subunit SecF [Sinimarinibacterium flocculans]|uniref:protein translocase subunit SecF n=1 Tax=Sinimarinibacterium flocculans TaxID=985250 RepID=UPI002492F626|nr:protein translocase subunit SecF [Sinimarinibacterium flocculans]
MRILSRVPNIDFMRLRVPAVGLSALLTVLAVLLIAFRGLSLGIDFTGGVLVEVSYPQSAPLEEVREALARADFEGASVQYFGTSQDVLIRLPPTADNDSAAISTAVLDALGTMEPAPELRRVEFVGSAVGDELAVDGGLAALFAIIGILIYVAFRFEWKFALGAIVATVHDALFVLGWFALLGIEFDLPTLAAVLAVIGYSLNDTIVIYDRIRENFLDLRKASPSEVINVSVNQTLARTIVTGGTTLFVLVALFYLAGSAVHNFAIALIVGVLVGTYSSIFVGSAMVLWLGVTREDLLPPAETEIDDMP